MMDHVHIVHEPLNVNSIYSLVCSPEYGAVSVFIGTTRDNFEGKTVARLEYEAYEAMAVKALKNICQSIRAQHNIGNMAVFHRLGVVPVQEASVVIAISSKHRKASLDALPVAIDLLKQKVPIWKKEFYAGDEPAEWKQNAESQSMAADTSCSGCQLYEEEVESEQTDYIPDDLIQIRVNAAEMNRRITTFMNRKRQQLNNSNLQDFCTSHSDPESSCARVNAVVVRKRGSKSHLRVHRVDNIVGPQTHGFDPGSVGSFKRPESTVEHKSAFCPVGAEERIANAEQFAGLTKNHEDVFKRLKAIEDRILYLESISPEYFDLSVQEHLKPDVIKMPKKSFTTGDLDLKLQHLETQLLQRAQKY